MRVVMEARNNLFPGGTWSKWLPRAEHNLSLKTCPIVCLSPARGRIPVDASGKWFHLFGATRFQGTFQKQKNETRREAMSKHHSQRCPTINSFILQKITQWKSVFSVTVANHVRQKWDQNFHQPSRCKTDIRFLMVCVFTSPGKICIK